MRRYFDEYRGLRETTGHVEHIGVRSTARTVRDQVARDRAFLEAQGVSGGGACAGRAARPPITAGAACSPRSGRGPTGCRPQPSARCHSRAATARARPRRTAAAPALTSIGPRRPRELFAEILDDGGRTASRRCCPRSRAPPTARRCISRSSFRRSAAAAAGTTRSSGRFRRSSEWGTPCRSGSTTPSGHQREWPAVSRREIREWFAPLEAPRVQGLRRVVRRRRRAGDRLADRVPACCGLDACRARAYFVQDHEPEFYATAAERRWAAETYTQGLHHDLRQPVARRPDARALRRHGVGLPARRRRRRLPPARRPAPARHRRVLRACGHRPPRGAARAARARRAASAAGPRRAS